MRDDSAVRVALRCTQRGAGQPAAALGNCHITCSRLGDLWLHADAVHYFHRDFFCVSVAEYYKVCWAGPQDQRGPQ